MYLTYTHGLPSKDGDTMDSNNVSAWHTAVQGDVEGVQNSLFLWCAPRIRQFVWVAAPLP